MSLPYTPSSLQDKIILITGAGQGIGFELAKHLALQGCRLILLSKTKRRLERIHDHICALTSPNPNIEIHKPLLIHLDLTDLDLIDQMGAQLFEKFGYIDGLVANAAQLKVLSPVAQFERKHVHSIMTTNFEANFRLIQNCDLLFRQAKDPRAIFMTIPFDDTPLHPYWGIYRASKAALEQMVISYAQEKQNISPLKVNLVDPGIVSTALRLEAFPGEHPQTHQLNQKTKELCAFLLSPDCMITGQKLNSESAVNSSIDYDRKQA